MVPTSKKVQSPGILGALTNSSFSTTARLDSRLPTMKSRKKYWREYYLKNKEHILAKNRKWELAHPERRRESRRQRRAKDRDKYNEKRREWVRKNLDKHRAWCRNYYRNKFETDINDKLRRCMQTRIRAG